MDIKLSFTMSRKDVFRSAMYYCGNTWLRWLRWVIGVCILILAAVALANGSVAFGIILIVVGGYEFFFVRLNAWILTRRVFAKDRPIGNLEYTLSDSAFHVVSPKGELTDDWSAFSRWMESPESFILEIYKGLFVMAPKRAFKSQSEIDEFRNFLQQRFKK